MLPVAVPTLNVTVAIELNATPSSVPVTVTVPGVVEVKVAVYVPLLLSVTELNVPPFDDNVTL